MNDTPFECYVMSRQVTTIVQAATRKSHRWKVGQQQQYLHEGFCRFQATWLIKDVVTRFSSHTCCGDVGCTPALLAPHGEETHSRAMIHTRWNTGSVHWVVTLARWATTVVSELLWHTASRDKSARGFLSARLSRRSAQHTKLHEKPRAELRSCRSPNLVVAAVVAVSRLLCECLWGGGEGVLWGDLQWWPWDPLQWMSWIVPRLQPLLPATCTMYWMFAGWRD